MRENGPILKGHELEMLKFVDDESVIFSTTERGAMGRITGEGNSTTPIPFRRERSCIGFKFVGSESFMEILEKF